MRLSSFHNQFNIKHLIAHNHHRFFLLLFIKAAKILGFALVFTPLTGCALATGLVYSALIRSVAAAPELEGSLFNYASLAFAFIETFAFAIMGAAAIVYSF